MIAVAAKLREDAPAELKAAYEELDTLSASDASGSERVEAMRAYSEAVNQWTKSHCDRNGA